MEEKVNIKLAVKKCLIFVYKRQMLMRPPKRVVKTIIQKSIVDFGIDREMILCLYKNKD